MIFQEDVCIQFTREIMHADNNSFISSSLNTQYKSIENIGKNATELNIHLWFYLDIVMHFVRYRNCFEHTVQA